MKDTLRNEACYDGENYLRYKFFVLFEILEVISCGNNIRDKHERFIISEKRYLHN